MTKLIDIRVCPMLTCGGLGTGPNGHFILLSDALNRSEAAETIWHEVIHLLKSSNPEAVHDEDAIEKAAKKLAAACPEVVEWCGLERQFPPEPEKLTCKKVEFYEQDHGEQIT